MPCRVLIVDDSATARAVIRKALLSDPAIEVIGEAGDPFQAADAIRHTPPDVLTLDLEMPRMDGLSFLKRLMRQRPIPVVVCSTLTGSGSALAFKALALGAVEVIGKPTENLASRFDEARKQLCETIKTASRVNVLRLLDQPKTPAPVTTHRPTQGRRRFPRLVLIGASTGGTEALPQVLKSFPADGPPTLIVQHMPPDFTRPFARRVDAETAMTVRQAAQHDLLTEGKALIAPGDAHLLLERDGLSFRVSLKDGPPVCRHRPSVDVLFRSAAKTAGSETVGVLLTGMGRDGAIGLRELRNAGGRTVAQDEGTSVVFGMARAAADNGAVEAMLPLPYLASKILELAYGS